ncbi:hypothetical protein VTL71DRAFT_9808 [Oculimacula yallundae]|uniref:Uncharacterized protein n=1 Tax=Oculimacula yallundae TaxID=86028 RepID=A0ABR4BSA1_9HELO
MFEKSCDVNNLLFAYVWHFHLSYTYYTNVNNIGAVITKTNAKIVWSVTASTTTTESGETATASVTTSCQLQTQVSTASCFTITGHGDPSIDGKKLYSHPHFGNPVFGGWAFKDNPEWDISLAYYYLTCAGQLNSLPSMKTLVKDDQSMYPLVVDISEYTGSGLPVTCTKNEALRTIQCGDGWYTVPPVAGTGDWTSGENSRSSFFGPSWTNTTPGSLPIRLTYDEVPCPCSY